MYTLRTLCLLLLAACALPLFAQDSFTPYIAKVSGESVRLRSGASLAHPPVCVLNDGDELTVVGEKEGWAVVQLPAEAPCWISADFVKPGADGKDWVVSGDKVNLRVSADTKYFPVGQAEKGQLLTAVIDGETGKPMAENGYVRVVPPANAHGAISLGLVTKVKNLAAEKAAEIVKETPKEAAPANPEGSPVPKAEEKAEEKRAAEAPKEETKRQPTKEELEDERKTFRELEKMLDDELKKPAAEVNLTEIRKMFEQFVEFALDTDISDKAALYIQKIDLTVKLIEAEKARLAEEDAKRKAEAERIAREATEKPKEAEQPKGPVEYLAIGTVGSTGKTAKTPASHRLFDENGKALYDLRWDKGDLSKLSGSKVGVVGTVKSYEGWPNKVIVIERIDVIDDSEEK
ncbi:MAG: hypothetical protein H6841_09410 [Planctomycetes bacterium]|nr:hypothetical protein [Planctomycetota bacterium]MCB9934452.1 hypothetical protein [Planctomycetota bacterium]